MQVKCTSCGASHSIIAAQNCDFCGNLIELESAKNNYQSFMNGESGNLMTMAETAIEATNWEEALQFFNRVLEKDITNSDAWLGKGIAIVYTSKIGELRITEAIAYWKNALKHAPNQEAMGKRVAKEINEVVNKFYPSLENHFIKFKDLDNSYGELVSKFVTLEAAQDYAVQLDSSNMILSQTGYALCSRVIQIPKKYALADESAAWVQGISGALQQNKYKTQDAVQARQKAVARKEEINRAAIVIYDLEEKYFVNIKKIDPDYNILRSTKPMPIDPVDLNAITQFKKDGTKMWYKIMGAMLTGYIVFSVLISTNKYLALFGFGVGCFLGWVSIEKIYPKIEKLFK
jgi:tetratricopeptide (TPR) repeat protein